MTDILSLFDTEAQSEDGAWLHLTIPGSDEPAFLDPEKTKPLRIKLKGPDSDTWTQFQRKAFSKVGEKDKRTPKEIAIEDAKLFARMTLAVENIPGFHGATGEKLFDLYVKYKDIRVQCLTFVMQRENFLQKPESA